MGHGPDRQHAHRTAGSYRKHLITKEKYKPAASARKRRVCYNSSMQDSSNKKRVLISGIGVAGILSAAMLDKEKYEVEMIEIADSFRNIGFSITLWKSGFKHLSEIIADNGETFTEGLDYFKVHDFNVFAGVHMKKIDELYSEGFAWVLERVHLMEILERILMKHVAKEQIRFSTSIKNVSEREDGVSIVRFNDGSEKAYDLVIVAEGINSSTRKELFPDQHVKTLDHSLKYAWFSTPTMLKQNGALFVTKGHLGVIHPPFFKDLLGFYSKNGTSEANQNAFQERVVSLVRQPNGEPSRIDLATSHVFDLKEVHISAYHKGSVVLVGDAAHGHPPTIGFGTTLAIEDSCMLVEKLNAIQTEVFATEMPKALAAYSGARIPRVKEVYRFQRKIHFFITNNTLMVKILSASLGLFAGKYIEKKVKRMAAYVLPVAA